MKLLSLATLVVLLLQQQRPTGSIEGTITRAGSNQPVANARVTITRRGVAPPGANVGQINGLPAPTVAPGGQRGGPAPAPIAPVTTDDKGKFVVPGLDDGAYNVNIVANGYVAQPYGQRAVGGPGAPVNVNGGQPTKDINVSLSPAANISGRVRDTSDQPLINLPVQLLRYSYDYQGQRSYQSVATTVTDDRGEYRMYWITPGRYYLLVGKPSTGSNPFEELMAADIGNGARANGNDVPSVLGYAFFPGVQEISNARSIDLQPGADLQSVDLALATKPRTFKVRGKIVDTRTGQPPKSANVFVAPSMPGLNANTDSFFGPEAPSPNYNGKTGIFEIRDLLPGTYSVVAMIRDTPLPGARGPVGQSSGMIPVSIGSSDVDGVTIPVVPAAPIPGRVRIDGQLPAQMTVERLRVQLTPTGASTGPQMSLSGVMANVLYQNSQATVAADGTFRFANVVPGDYRIDFNGFPVNANSPGGTQYFGTMQTANGYLKEARLDGVDVMSAPLHFSGSVNNGLEITLAFGSGRIDGTVTDVRSQPAAAGRVVAVPDRARFRTDLYRSSQVDQSGKFIFPSLSPGDYKVFAWESIEDNGWFDPDLLARNEGRARSVHVSEAATQTITVQIIPAETTR